MDFTNKTETYAEVTLQHPAAVFGEFDQNIKIIENALKIRCVLRDDVIRLFGEARDRKTAAFVLKRLSDIAEKGEPVTEQQVRYALSLKEHALDREVAELDNDTICHTINGKPVKPKTLGQKAYVDAIRKKMVVFGVGPAGTGKTCLAMAMAVTAFRKEEVSRIILTRPAIEAGEKLGFLPGDLQQKIDPYLRPLYDALYQIMGAENCQRNLEKGVIEVAPLAYMRGRTLDNSFIILDEAQNTTPAQMKMFLTRIGFGAKAVITGDATQKDLPSGTQSGLDHALKVLKNMPEIGICRLTGDDVVRHPLVQKIVNAYEDYEHKTADNKVRVPSVKRANVRKTAAGQ